MMDIRLILDGIAVVSAIYSTAVWIANHQIQIKLENKIEKQMIILSSRMQRQQDRNKTRIGILEAKLDQMIDVANGNPSCINLAKIVESLPEEETDFN
jgi:hypothetical protein